MADTENEKRYTADGTITIKLVEPPHSQGPSDDRNEQPEKWWQGYARSPNKWAALTFLATAIYAAFAILLWIETRNIGKATRRSIREASHSAEVSDRPWVLLADESEQVLDKNGATIALRNVGKSPAFQVGSISIGMPDKEGRLCKTQHYLMLPASPPGAPVLGPGQTLRTTLPRSAFWNPAGYATPPAPEIVVEGQFDVLVSVGWRDQHGSDGFAELCVRIDDFAKPPAPRISGCRQCNRAGYVYARKNRGAVAIVIEPPLFPSSAEGNFAGRLLELPDVPLPSADRTPEPPARPK